MKIFIDAGHGGHDPGACSYNCTEKSFTLDIATKSTQMFKNLGHEVHMTRTDDSFVALTQRAKLSNMIGADIFISFHCNSGGGRGVEVWHSLYSSKGKEYANKVNNKLKEINVSRGLKTKKGKHGDFIYVLRATSCPAILVEFGFMDNSNDVELLKDGNIRTRYAQAVVSAFTGKQVFTKSNTSGSLDGRIGIVDTKSSNLLIRDKPCEQGNKLGSLPKGSRVKIFKKCGEWYSIYYGSHGGYVSAKYIKLI